MMDISIGNIELLNKLREALGITEHIRGLTLRVYVNEPASVTVERFVRKEQMSAALPILESLK